jgi:hypothetical protein
VAPKNACMVAIPQSTHSWLGRFCVRLMQLRPDTHVVHAVQDAVATFPYASSLEPEDAAEVFAQRHPADHVIPARRPSPW